MGLKHANWCGSYLLSKLSQKYGNKIGLYRDDGLAAFNETPRRIDMIKKDICKVFNDHNLNLTIEANKKTVDYLDITLDLRTGVFKPYSKPNNIPLYVHHHSNHPPSILRNIPESINRRLSSILSDKKSFDTAAPTYQEALRKSGYDYELNFNPETPKEKCPAVETSFGTIPPTALTYPLTSDINSSRQLTNHSPRLTFSIRSSTETL